MSVAVRSKTAHEDAASAGGVITVNMPATVSAGDTLRVVISQDIGVNNTAIDVGTSGFTRIASQVDSTIRGAVFSKKAAGDEGGGTRAFSGGASNQFAASSVSFQGAADPSVTPPTISAKLSGSGDTTAELPNVNPGVSKEYYWDGVCCLDRRNFSGYPADLTLDQQTAGTSAISNASVASAGKVSTATNYTPTGTFSLAAADEWISWTLAIHPAAAGPATAGLQIGAATKYGKAWFAMYWRDPRGLYVAERRLFTPK